MRPLMCLLMLSLGNLPGVSYGAIGPQTSEDLVYTLYRNSALDANMRLHVATFDADEGEGYNRENCESARSLFSRQPGVTVKYWCEKGYYRKEPEAKTRSENEGGTMGGRLNVARPRGLCGCQQSALPAALTY